MGDDERSEQDGIDAGLVQAGMAGEGSIRWVTADVTPAVEYMRPRVDFSPVAAAAFGQALAGATLLAQLQAKNPLLLKLEVRGDGPIGRVVAEVEDGRVVRGLVGNPQVVVPDADGAALDVAGAVGRGLLRVSREYAGAQRYDSQVELVTGRIANDLAHYLEQSEQTRSAILLGVLARPVGVTAACGILVEAVPGARESVLARVEQNVAAAGEVSRIMEQGGLPALKNAVLDGLERTLLHSERLAYRCRCDRERLLRSLVLMADEDLASLREPGGGVTAECAYCGAVYEFAREELDWDERASG
jgi:molecular chaperone Hsp33